MITMALMKRIQSTIAIIRLTICRQSLTSFAYSNFCLNHQLIIAPQEPLVETSATLLYNDILVANIGDFFIIQVLSHHITVMTVLDVILDVDSSTPVAPFTNMV